MKEESHNPGIAPELEARIAALVLGELSDLERDELNRLIDERPDLAALKEQFENVHGLMRDVGAGESIAPQDDLKLPAEKRSALLAAISGEAKEQPTNPLVINRVEGPTLVKESLFWKLSKIAAVFCVVGILFGLMTIPGVRLAREASSFVAVDSGLAEGASRSHKDMFSMENSVVGGAALEYSRSESQAAGRRSVDNNFPADVKSIADSDGARVFDADGFMKADAFGFAQDFPAEQESEEVSGLGFGNQLQTNEPENKTPSQPIIAGMRINASGMDASTTGESLDLVTPPPSVSSSAINGPTASTENFKKSQELADATVDKQEGAKGRMTVPDLDDLALGEGRESSGGARTLGGAIHQSLERLDARTAEQDVRLRTETLGEDSQGQPAAPEKLNRETPVDEQGANFFQESRGVIRNGQQGEPLPQRGQSAANGRNQAGLVTPMLRSQEKKITEWSMGDKEKTTMNEQQPTSGVSATKVNRDWLKELARPRLQETLGKGNALLPGLHEMNAQEEAFSTFSLHVSDVSFKLAQAALARGEWPEPAQVRIEEFVNAFDYGDPMPSHDEKVSCRSEQSIHPFLQQRNLLRVSMRTAAAGRASNTPLRLTFLLDNSGSMERIDRQQTVRRAFALLAQQLKATDQVTLISFARQPRLLADKVSGAQSRELIQIIDELPSEGGTNLGAALQLAFEKAQEQQADGAQNRIILLTDGAVNLGDADPESLSRMIKTMRESGIAFDAAGISAEGLNDEILEALTRQGDGRYYLLDSLEAADEGFARQIAGALRPSAKNVKVQVEFNPNRVGRYKLLGFEKHLLKQEDFRNDKVDAAEMAAAEAGVAVYQFEAKADGEGDVGSVSVRFRDLSTGQMIENRWPIPYQADAPRVDQAAPSLRIAISAAFLAAKLRGESLGEIVDLKTLSDLISGLPDQDRNAKRVQQLQLMIGQARQVSGN